MRTAVTWWDDERITWYERAAGASSFHKNIAEEIKAMIRKEDRIEEEGCGLGHIAQILAADGYDIKACDADRKAIERARKRSSLDIFSVRDFRDPLPYADVLLMIYFGRIAENDSLDRLLEAAPAVIYILSHHRGQDTDMRAKKSNVEETITYLDSKGASYETKTVTYDFSQPLISIEEAERYIARMYGKENIRAFLPFLKEGNDYPYMLRNMKTSTIFTIRR